MRHILIDTDTGSDDVWAIIAALRATEDVHVDAITVVCGNVPLETCVKNALIATEVANTYFPPVYSGMSRPMVKEKLFSADYVHGSDGLGEMNLPYPAHQPEKQHAVDAPIAVLALLIDVWIPPVALLACSAKLEYCPIPSLLSFTICCINCSMEIFPDFIAL